MVLLISLRKIIKYSLKMIEQSIFTTNNLWLLIATILVFIMHLGFASLEAGMTRAKNTVNILFKNTLILPIGLLAYALVGYNLMFPGDVFAGEFFGFSGFGLTPPENGDTAAFNGASTFWTTFIFQAMFAATAATIVSGAVAERINLMSFLLFSLVYVGLCYPIIGFWKWGGGFLDKMDTPFYDFAGSTIVHSVGGWAALAGVILLGSRTGKYEGKQITPIRGHSMPLATLGVFMLWFGWFGFNGGSVLSADPKSVSLVFVTTAIAGAAGAIGAFFTSYFQTKSYDLTMPLNGILAGLVSITASADQVSVMDAILIGLIGGVLVVIAISTLDKLKLDDPVGAIPVHLVCGIWGTLAVGLFGDLASANQLVSQFVGVLVIGLACFGASFGLFFLIKKTIGLRVSLEEEAEGLDIAEHRMSAYTQLTKEYEIPAPVKKESSGVDVY